MTLFFNFEPEPKPNRCYTVRPQLDTSFRLPAISILAATHHKLNPSIPTRHFKAAISADTNVIIPRFSTETRQGEHTKKKGKMGDLVWLQRETQSEMQLEGYIHTRKTTTTHHNHHCNHRMWINRLSFTRGTGASRKLLDFDNTSVPGPSHARTMEKSASEDESRNGHSQPQRLFSINKVELNWYVSY